MAAEPETLRGLERPRLDEWLAAHLPDAAPPFSFRLIAAGGSNLTYRMEDAHGVLRVLRRAREAFLNEDGGAAGAHAVLRLGMDCFAPERFDRTCGLASMKGVRLRVERCESVRPAPSRGKGKKGGTSTEVCVTIFAGQI